ncbi:MAG: type IX secretion system membrane protein PorP/SprF, partial [Bacteroidales bacterium]|nr:type IX secretion system membrane protein PorP/SprF [Bacteroidales bacterium]
MTVLLLMFALVAKAQFDGQFSQYMLNPALFNPAAIGEGEELVVNLTNRQQWTSIDNAPKTFLLNASLPKLFGASRHGFGLLIM